MADQKPEVCSFFSKPSKNRANIRKRQATSDSESDPDQSQPESKLPSKKTLTNSNLHFSSKPASTSKPESEPEPEPDNSKLFHFESSKEIQTHHDSGATATLETETDFSRDARAIRERILKQSAAAGGSGSKPKPGSEKLYKGINSYTDYKAGFRREQTVASEKAGGAHGPLRASAHIRTSMRFDYQPDICKDYKETGYCGFGDSCKFMHDRGDYKSGWQMEKEWEEKEKARKRAMAMREAEDEEGEGEGGGGGDSDDEDALPFACFICRKPFEDAVVTKCKHYFCEHCALKVLHQKAQKCLEDCSFTKPENLFQIYTITNLYEMSNQQDESYDE